MKKKSLFIIIISFIFVGCGEKSIEQQQKECIEEGKQFYKEKVFNMREGKHILKGKCI